MRSLRQLESCLRDCGTVTIYLFAISCDFCPTQSPVCYGHLLPEKVLETVYLPLFFMSEEQHDSERFNYFIFLAVTFGVLGSMLLYNASLYLFTRDASYAWYTFYVSSITAYITCASNLALYVSILLALIIKAITTLIKKAKPIKLNTQ